MKTNKNSKKSYVPQGEDYLDEQGQPLSRQMAVHIKKNNHKIEAQYDETKKNQENLRFIYQFLKRTKNLHLFDSDHSRAQASFYGSTKKEIGVSDYIYERFHRAFLRGLESERNRLSLIIQTEKEKKAEFEKNLDIFSTEYFGNHKKVVENQDTARELLAVIQQTAKLSKLLQGISDFTNPYSLAAIAKNKNLKITAQRMFEAFQAYKWVLETVISQCEQKIKHAQAENSKLFNDEKSFTPIAPVFEKKHKDLTM
jgi:hypothetical protein